MYDIKNLNIWKEQEESRPNHDYLNADISELNLSVRSYNCLKRAKCNTIGDILALIADDENGLRGIRNLGRRSEAEILENVQQFREQFNESETPLSGPMAKRTLIRPAKKIWDKRIEEYPLSEYAMTHLQQHGIRRVKDLYLIAHNDPGWFAVRELFEKIATS